MKGKGWILDLIEGGCALALTAGVIYVGCWINKLDSKIDENKKTLDTQMNDFQETINDKMTEQNDSIIKCYKEIPQIREEERENRKMMMDMLNQRFEKLEKKNENYNLTFIVNEGSNRKEIKIKNINDEYMRKLLDYMDTNDMDKMYNTVSQKGIFKINTKLGLYYVTGRLKSMDEFDKLKFKSLENCINSASNSISEVNVERAE